MVETATVGLLPLPGQCAVQGHGHFNRSALSHLGLLQAAAAAAAAAGKWSLTTSGGHLRHGTGRAWRATRSWSRSSSGPAMRSIGTGWSNRLQWQRTYTTRLFCCRDVLSTNPSVKWDDIADLAEAKKLLEEAVRERRQERLAGAGRGTLHAKHANTAATRCWPRVHSVGGQQLQTFADRCCVWQCCVAPRWSYRCCCRTISAASAGHGKVRARPPTNANHRKSTRNAILRLLQTPI